ncbi:hypothetical protein [Streptomyces sp. NBC_01217]|uniref:hypothetical protein n=1 Tax=Streptomyces sp. NBC_01217 TaxID=2903779 RepID=UPI002E126ED1|nr:hypothetical protein OG507_11570 [Streptomyces sp. NBC_01217]
MSDVYAVDLALDLRASVSSAVLADLRWHLGTEDAAEGSADGIGDMAPLLAERGPAMRIGGVLVGELARTADGWSLTARQEVHAELLPELDSLAERLAWHSRTEGVIGQIRFYEEEVPDLLVNRAGELMRTALAPRGETSR